VLKPTCGSILVVGFIVYTRGSQSAAHEPHVALPRFLCGSFSFPKNYIFVFYFYIFLVSTLKKLSKNYTCFILRRFRLFLIHLQFWRLL